MSIMMHSWDQEGETDRLMRRALRTLLAMNLEANPMEFRRRVKSPVAAAPRRICSERMWLDRTRRMVKMEDVRR